MRQNNRSIDRTRSFRTRLAAEREILALVNSAPRVPELLGLTEAAIDDWVSRSSRDPLVKNTARLSEILRAIAISTGTISDQSREILLENEIKIVGTDLIAVLEKALFEANRI